MAKFKKVNVCPPPEAIYKRKHKRRRKKSRRKDFELKPEKVKTMETEEDRCSKLTEFIFYSISGGGKLLWLICYLS